MTTTTNITDDQRDTLPHAPSVARMFLDRVARTPHGEAYRYPDGSGWRSLTWSQTARQVQLLAAGLIALGVRPQQRIAIASGTRYEWIAADLAIMCAGAATTTVYPTTKGSDVAYILTDSDCQVVFAENTEQLAKLRAHRAEFPNVRTVVLIDGPAPDDDWIITLDDLERRGDELLAREPHAVRDRAEALSGDHLATIIYTSGTTGTPKGVRLPHSGWTYQAEAIAAEGILTVDDRQLLWLPMAHAFGKVLLSVQLAVGFPTAIDGRVDRIVPNLADVGPTWMAAVPRVFEKAHARITIMAEHRGGLTPRLFRWAFGVGKTVSRARRDGTPLGLTLALRHRIADRLVLAKIRNQFGGRIRFFVSGSAALDPDIAEWFHAAGMLILEGYGLTETTAVASINRPDEFRFSTIGPPLPGTEIRLADDSEILIKGPGVMAGYHNRDEQTRETIDPDGWLHTGDIGERDPDGFIRITDRKKDLFKTSGGKYVAPAAIEGKFAALCPYVSRLFVHGNERNYCTALVTLDADAITEWARHHGLGEHSYPELVSSPQVQNLIQSYIDDLNKSLNRWETIKKFAILGQEFTVESGELTPSLKTRRKTVEHDHRATLDALYPQ